MRDGATSFVKVLDFLWYCFKLCLIVGVMFMIVTNTLVNSGKTVIENNWTEYRCSPLVMPFANRFGRDTQKNAMDCLFTSFKASFGLLMKPLQYIMSIVQDTMKNQHNSMNLFRAILKPIRIFFMSATKKFYDLINHFTGMSVYLFAKIRDILRRMGSTFQLTLYSLQGIQMMIQSIWDGPVGEISRDWGYALDAISSFFCLAPGTKIRIADGSIKLVENLQIGDSIHDGNGITRVTGIVKTSSRNVSLYLYRGVVISGNHLVCYKDYWYRLKECPGATLISNKGDFTYLYCPITDSHQIQLDNGVLVRDFEEVSVPILERDIISTSLQYLNQSNNIQFTDEELINVNDQPGFTGNSLITMFDGSQKPISGIKIGDRLTHGNVLGIAYFKPSYSLIEINPTTYCTRRQIILDKTEEKHEWKLANLVNPTPHTDISGVQEYCYSLITTNGIYQVNQVWASDLLDGLPSSEMNAIERKIQVYLNNS